MGRAAKERREALLPSFICRRAGRNSGELWAGEYKKPPPRACEADHRWVPLHPRVRRALVPLVRRGGPRPPRAHRGGLQLALSEVGLGAVAAACGCCAFAGAALLLQRTGLRERRRKGGGGCCSAGEEEQREHNGMVPTQKIRAPLPRAAS